MLFDNAGIPSGRGDRRRIRLQRDECRGTTDLFEHPVAAELLGDGDSVRRFALSVETGDRGEDEPVRRAVEVALCTALERDSCRISTEQHRPEQRLLRLHAVGRNPTTGSHGRGVHRPRSASTVFEGLHHCVAHAADACLRIGRGTSRG